MTEHKYYCSMSSPIGPIFICQDGDAVCRISCGEPTDKDCRLYERTPLIERAVSQLEEYFCGHRRSFDLPIAVSGTEFQRKVYKALCAIPYGETRSYKQIAEETGSAKAYRAVGQANHDNPLIIVIPCHRVIGSSGHLTGYAYGTARKQYLLDLEKRCAREDHENEQG